MININTDKWITQQALATELNVSIQRVHNWVRRGKIDCKTIPEMRITLVDRDSVSIKTINKP